MISKTTLRKEIKLFSELIKTHQSQYLIGYRNGLKWVLANYTQIAYCQLKRIDCMGGACLDHYKCETCNHYHNQVKVIR